jgi:hypothetical protein
MMTLPPAHILGAALAQSVGGALLTILAICVPLLALWALCYWLERWLSAGEQARAQAGEQAGDAPAPRPAPRPANPSVLMAPLELSAVELATVATFPALQIVRPDAPSATAPTAPSATPPAIPPVGSSIGVLDGRLHGYIRCADGRLVRIATLRLQTVYPLSPWYWN